MAEEMNIPVNKNITSELVDKWHEEHGNSENPRPYMGISMVGHECPRYLWLKFRWAVREKFSGRMLRLFRRGQLEEAQIVKDLENLGCVITHTGDDQAEVYFGGWVKGHLDGIIESGVPEAPKKVHVLECKTHNDKSFQELKKKGVEVAKPLHWAQMQCYMIGIKTDRTLYYAVNKNDDEVYTERVRLDRAAAQDIVRRGEDIAVDPFMPAPLSQDPTFFKCKMCPCWEFCHQTHQTKELNCRTCRFFSPDENGKAMCSRYRIEIPYENQLMACTEYKVHPDLGSHNP